MYKGGEVIYLDLVASKHEMQHRPVLGAGPGGARRGGAQGGKHNNY